MMETKENRMHFITSKLFYINRRHSISKQLLPMQVINIFFHLAYWYKLTTVYCTHVILVPLESLLISSGWSYENRTCGFKAVSADVDESQTFWDHFCKMGLLNRQSSLFLKVQLSFSKKYINSFLSLWTDRQRAYRHTDTSNSHVWTTAVSIQIQIYIFDYSL